MDCLNGRVDTAEEKTGERRVRQKLPMMLHKEEKYESKVKRHVDRMRRSNICLIIVLEGEDRENGKEAHSEVMVENFQKLMKDLN